MDLLDTSAVRKPSPWDDARAARPDALLVRLIFPERGLQFFLSLHPTPERRAEASVWDGATIISPVVPQGYSPEEFDRIVADFDAAWEARA